MQRTVLAAMVVAGGMLVAAGCAQEPAGEADFLEASPVTDAPIGPLPGRTETEPDDAQNPFSDAVDALAEGRRYFVAYNCAGCHGDHGGGGMGPSLRDDAWLYGSSDLRIANSIAEGRAYGMPTWGRMLTPAQIWQITAYIKSMRTPREPQPPT